MNLITNKKEIVNNRYAKIICKRGTLPRNTKATLASYQKGARITPLTEGKKNIIITKMLGNHVLAYKSNIAFIGG